MTSTTVRVREETRKILRELAEQAGEPMLQILAKAVEVYRRQYILERANMAYEAMRSDSDAWQEEERERSAWDATLADDLGEQ